MQKTYTCLLRDKPQPPFKREPAAWAPMLKVRVGWAHQKTPRFDAIVDSGSPYCLFRYEVGNYLGIDISGGKEGTIGGISEGLQESVYFHKVQIWVEENWLIEVTAGFVKKLTFSGILGRNGFFDNFHVHFDHTAYPPIVEIEKIALIQ